MIHLLVKTTTTSSNTYKFKLPQKTLFQNIKCRSMWLNIMRLWCHWLKGSNSYRWCSNVIEEQREITLIWIYETLCHCVDRIKTQILSNFLCFLFQATILTFKHYKRLLMTLNGCWPLNNWNDKTISVLLIISD